MNIKFYLLHPECKLKMVKAYLHELGLFFKLIQQEILKYIKDYFSNKKKSNALNLVPCPGYVVEIARKNYTRALKSN